MNIADLFKEKLQNQSIETPPDLWNKLEEHLNISESLPNQEIINKAVNSSSQITSTAAKMASWKIAAIAASSVAAAGIIAFAVITNLEPKQNISNDTVQTIQPIEEKLPDTDTNENLPDISKNTNTPVLEKASVIPLSTSKSNNTNTSYSNSNQNIKEPVNNTSNTIYPNNNQLLPNSQNQVVTKISEPENQASIASTTSTSDNNNITVEKPQIKEEISSTSAREEAVLGTNPHKEVKQTEASNMSQNFVLRIPNAITPNGDGLNDFWIINDLDKLTSYSLRVIDQRQKKVFETAHYQNNWGGDNLPAGTYFYIIQYVITGVEKVQRGVIEIVK